jgi:phosphoenolpyruvate carboxykinase (GTP)
LWPGFGENSRVLDWVLKRCDGADVAESSPIGLIPKQGSIDTNGLKEQVNWEELFSLPKNFWQDEVLDLEKYFSEQFGNDLPNAIAEELHKLKQRVNQM